MRIALRVALALAAAALLAPTPASAGSFGELMADCPDGVLGDGYSRGQLNRGLGNIPADSTEYGYCRDAIAAALMGGGAGGNAKPSRKDGPGNGSKLDANGDGTVTPAEKRAAKRQQRRERARDRERAEITALADDPTGAPPGPAVDDASGGVSWPLALSTIALMCAAVGGGLWYAARRNPSLARALGRMWLPGRRA